MAVSTAADIIRGALQALGVVAAGEAVEAEDADLGLELLNGLLDQYAAERYAIYTSTRTTWTITQTASFTLGTSGTINRVRPVFLDHVSYLDPALTTPQEVPLVPLTEDAYAAWPEKTQTSAYPTAYYYNPTFASSMGTLYLLPIATTSLTGVIYAPTAVARFAAITTAFSLPPGYERMLRTNLAMECAAPFEREPSAWVMQAAAESKATVKRSNIRLMDMSIEAGALGHAEGAGGWSIVTGP